MKKYFVVNLGASLSYKRWPVERFAVVIEWIYSRTGLIPYFIGSAMEDNLVTSIKEYYSGAMEDYCGKTSLRDLFILVGNASFYLGNDTGTTHVAAAVGIPNFSIACCRYPPVCVPYPSNYIEKDAIFPTIIKSLKDREMCKECRIEQLLHPEEDSKYCWAEPNLRVTYSCRDRINEIGCIECLSDITIDQVIDVIERSGILDEYAK